MSETKTDSEGEILSHNYDGIHELDNPLPTWWLITFLITIIFGFLYWIHYDIGKAGLSSDQELSQAMAQIKLLQKNAAAHSPSFDEEVILALSKDSSALAEGQAEYSAKC